VGIATVCADGNDGVAFGGNALKSGGVGAIVGTDFTVSLDRMESDSRFLCVEGLQGWQVGGLTYDFHFIRAFEKIVDETGQAVMVAETKVAKKEEAHCGLVAIYYWRCMV